MTTNTPESRHDGRHPRDVAAWILVAIATFATTVVTLSESLVRYHELRSGWSWDLAYYNQWCWAMTHGNQRITVRPIADYATEGPSTWKTNYLAPIRYLILPIYRLWPDPVTLLIVHGIIFWWILPASYGLVYAETGSVLAGLTAVPLVWLTPLLLPLAANDFRELQLALPFVLWAVHGVRARSVWRAALGVAGVLACRQEYAVFVASLAVIAPARPESVISRYRWARALWLAGLGWMLVVFFGYLVIVDGWGTPAEYVRQFLGPKAAILDTVWTALGFLAIGLGSWSVLAMASPRAALLGLPWLWSLSSGRWAIGYVGTTAWHHVRYAAPLAATGIVAGLLGGSRLWRFAGRFPHPGMWRGACALIVLAGLLFPRWVLARRFGQVPHPVSRAEAVGLWPWIRRVEPTDGVLAHYDFTAPLSSRSALYSYVMKQNEPLGFPDNLPTSITWVFCHPDDIPAETLYRQGFNSVHRGGAACVYRRMPVAADPKS